MLKCLIIKMMQKAERRFLAIQPAELAPFNAMQSRGIDQHDRCGLGAFGPNICDLAALAALVEVAQKAIAIVGLRVKVRTGWTDGKELHDPPPDLRARMDGALSSWNLRTVEKNISFTVPK